MQDMLKRQIQRLLIERLDANPAVAVVGPRQCGKTTLAQLLGGMYFDLEQESDLVQPWVGASWEGFVIQQTIGVLSSLGRTFEAFYFRTSDQHELDLVLQLGKELWAVEIKLTASPSPADMERLDRTASMIGASRRFLVSQTRKPSGNETRASCNLPWLLSRLQRPSG
jgi:predicted AAA+ superfamily ATPase